MADEKDYKNSLNLPRTAFAMKAKLTEMEPAMLRKWEAFGLYDKIIASRQGRKPFVLHDGPPYANGLIHLGTAMNKILKDFIVKSKTMRGYLAPYLPGWDCHGLPIEIHVDKLLGDKKKDIPLIAFREECKAYALKFIDIQRGDFKRLGVFGEWDDPYLTLKPSYEADILRRLASFFAAGDAYKGKRPVHWCPTCRTALAEAEIIYKDKKSPSIYVKFPMVSDLSGLAPALKGKKVSVIIWTTTPWTLPANLAVAFHPEYEYAVFEAGSEAYLVAKRLVPVIAEILGIESPKILATIEGRLLEKLKARHPFLDRESVFVLADYVTLDDGTGCVHTAPGHGYEDYLTGKAYGLDVYTPVDDKGEFTADVPIYAGMNVFKANPVINADMAASGRSCIRPRSPILIPTAGDARIRSSSGRPPNGSFPWTRAACGSGPWRKSRRSAGSPPGVRSGSPGWSKTAPTGASPASARGACRSRRSFVRVAARSWPTSRKPLHVAGIFEAEGSNAWFVKTADELLPPGTVLPHPAAAGRSKRKTTSSTSGSNREPARAFSAGEPDLPWPADVYIEGHDQHRGWFNSSLLVGVGSKGGSPFRTCITHGFVLDEQGKAMSKSAGNIVEPRDVIAQNGAEILRLWIAMLNFKEDAPFGKGIVQHLVEAYRKIRNTWRFLLGNLSDFRPDVDSLDSGGHGAVRPVGPRSQRRGQPSHPRGL